jgi:phosphoglycolate phosphatase
MTNPAVTGEPLVQLVARARYLLLDFDGPICDIFAGLPATAIASRLRKLITGQGITIPEDITRTPDPIEVFTYSATISTDLARQVEAEMTSQEITATATASPAPYAHDLIASSRQSGRPVAIVSNNAEQAVRAYLTRHGLADRIDFIAARTTSDPALLKPNLHLLQQAMNHFGGTAAECLLVGDSTTDMQAATHTGMPSIGYANKPGKATHLAQAGATAIVTSLADLVLAIRARPSTVPKPS